MGRGHLHFLGIGGHAMRGVALAARDLGYAVTGTDEGAYPPGSDWLDEHEFTWWREADPAHLRGVTEVIVSGHVGPDHPELVAAQEQGIAVRSFPELVGELTAPARRIVVAGTHGKTTTTSLIAWLLDVAGLRPDFLIGIKPHNFPSSVRLAGSKLAVIEGDEYRASQLETVSKFAYYKPDVAILTSIEMDHPDFFRDLGDISGRFREFVSGMPTDGTLYYWNGSPSVREIVAGAAVPKESYDLADAAWWADDIEYLPQGLRYRLMHGEDELALVAVPLFGHHNVLNSVAAAAVVLGEGVSVENLVAGFRRFKGASRRLERISAEDAPVLVLDDYAHHPTEAAATIQAAKLHFSGKLIAIYRPHTYSRTEKLLDEYRQAFEAADVTIIAPIEAAREQRQAHTVSGADVAKGAVGNVEYVPERSDILTRVCELAGPGDTILSMSVNGYDGLAAELNKLVNQ